MEALKKKIMTEGKAIGTDIIKVDSFLNHQIDVAFMNEIGKEFARIFSDVEVTKIVTIEASAIMISKKYISSEDKILIIDDFLANGKAALALKNLCEQAGATVQGVGIVIEKGFQSGGKLLREENHIRVESLAIIDSIDDGKITFRD